MATETPPLPGPADAVVPRPLAKKRFRPADALFFGGRARSGADLARRAGVAPRLDPGQRAPGPGLGLPDRQDLDQPRDRRVQLVHPGDVHAHGDHVRLRDPGRLRGRALPREVRLDQPGAAPVVGPVARAAAARPEGERGVGAADPPESRLGRRVPPLGARRPDDDPHHRRQHLQPRGGALDHLRPARPRRLRGDHGPAEEPAGRRRSPSPCSCCRSSSSPAGRRSKPCPCRSSRGRWRSAPRAGRPSRGRSSRRRCPGCSPGRSSPCRARSARRPR